MPGTGAGALTRLTTPVLVGLVVVAALVLTRPTPALRTSALVTSATASDVCVDAPEGSLCWDAEHVDHLRLGGVREGDCLEVVYAARWAPGTVSRATGAPCPP
ncbi:hypothetical protein [Angustibacter speluncae]